MAQRVIAVVIEDAVCRGRFAVDRGLCSSVGLPHEKDVEEGELTIFFFLSCEVDAGHLHVDYLVELVYRGGSEYDECIVHIPYPQTRLYNFKGFGFEVFHNRVREQS